MEDGQVWAFHSSFGMLSHNYQKKNVMLARAFPTGFIDADDETSEVPQRRANSLPPFRVCDLMEQEEDLPTFEVSMQNYVENLSEQWQAKSPLDLRSPSFSPTNVGCDGSPTSDGSTLEPSISIPTVARQAEQAISPGSLGHPEVCRRQCIYFLQGHCFNGDACTYCHLPHTQRAPKLDKRQRSIMQLAGVFNILVFFSGCMCLLFSWWFQNVLFWSDLIFSTFFRTRQALSHQEVLALMQHLCTAKAEEIGMLKEAQEVISILTAEANGLRLPSMAEREIRALCKTLSRMKLDFSQVFMGLVPDNFNFRAKRQCCDSSFSETPTTCPAGVFPVSWAWWRIENLSAAWRQTARSVSARPWNGCVRTLGRKSGEPGSDRDGGADWIS